MPDYVTYRIPKSHATLVEKLFAAYQVPCEELSSEVAGVMESIQQLKYDRELLEREKSFLRFMTTGRFEGIDA